MKKTIPEYYTCTIAFPIYHIHVIYQSNILSYYFRKHALAAFFYPPLHNFVTVLTQRCDHICRFTILTPKFTPLICTTFINRIFKRTLCSIYHCLCQVISLVSLIDTTAGGLYYNQIKPVIRYRLHLKWYNLIGCHPMISACHIDSIRSHGMLLSVIMVGGQACKIQHFFGINRFYHSIFSHMGMAFLE